jgi:diguanylate cyclase (GGDEF)-like protein
MSDDALKLRHSIAVFAVRVGLAALVLPLAGLLFEMVAAHGHLGDAALSLYFRSPIFVGIAATPFIVAFFAYILACSAVAGISETISKSKHTPDPCSFDLAYSLNSTPSRLAIESRFQKAIDVMHEGFLLHDRRGRIQLFNARALKILELTGPQLKGEAPISSEWQVVFDDGIKTQKFDAPMQKALGAGAPQRAILMRIQPPGKRAKWAMLTCEPIEEGDDGRPLYIVTTMADVTEQRDVYAKLQDYTIKLEARANELEQENGILSTLATIDSLTGLKNYRAFRERLTTDLHRCSKFHNRLGLLLLDLDNFKSYNDRYGHLVGDDILRNVGAAIQSNVREVDMAARYGGEEFAIVIPDANEKTLAAAAERVRRAVEGREWEYGPVTVSIGGAIGNEFTGSADKLIVEADQALYRSKSSGKNCVTLFGLAESVV